MMRFTMSLNLAVWEGPTPRTDFDARAEFARLYDSSKNSGLPTPAIVRYVEAVTAKYPCICTLDDDSVDDGVWSDGPLINNARGRLFYFGIVGSRFREVAPFAVSVAHEMGLVCFDPQSGALIL